MEPISAAEKKAASVKVVKNTIRRSIATEGIDRLIAIQKDGTVVEAGDISKSWKKDYPSWENFASISAGGNHLVGLRSDSTVVTENPGQYDVSNWTEIMAIRFCGGHLAGLREDGTIEVTGDVNKGVLT